jgi:hypothetical protein
MSALRFGIALVSAVRRDDAQTDSGHNHALLRPSRNRYQIEGFTVTTMLMVNFCIYAMLKLFGFGVGYPAFDFWFPRGENSLYFTLVAFGLELVQDLVAHIIAEKAARRHPGKCKFTRMYPGWLLKPSTGLVPVAKACCSVSNAAVFMTQLSFAMRQLYDI